ncbi:hypothetical protein RHMOL_Rhmol01G0083500 [Rhododendron molle]|uniref:Uncharacterized protein n=1 Tax=Rhododendron molle TaxID=49168 RepID=A0ACC0PZ15_RHOML|nr:hypothetical protein RHMOL_Rhmol01G0083500 [Rhododendron molle]
MKDFLHETIPDWSCSNSCGKPLFLSFFKNFSTVMTELLDDAFRDGALQQPSEADEMAINLEDTSAMELDKENAKPEKSQMESSDDSDEELESDSDDETIITLVTLALHEHHQKYYNRIPCRTSILRGHDYVLEVLNGHDARCDEGFRMETHVFIAFCEALKVHTGLKHSRYLTVQEQAVCKLGKLIIQPPPFDEVPPEIMHNQKYWPFFKDCIGAIDGTHIDAKVPAREQIPYRGRHKTTSQNVMAACSFDMRFTYVLSGWEGTANDSRVLFECANDPTMEFPMAPLGKYYVVDSGYQNMPGFLTPYKGERYHLSLFRGRRRLPTKEEEWFNYRHSSLRNVIERCFGALKARFPILKQMPKGFTVRTQKYLPTACCTVHNFIRMHDKNDAVFKFYSKEDLIVESEQGQRSSSQQINVTPAQLREMARVRNTIARQIFNSQRL